MDSISIFVCGGMKQSVIIKILQYQVPLIAWCIFIYTVSSIPQTKIPNFVNYTDKIVHACVFFVLCWLAHVAFYFQPSIRLRRRSLLLALLFVILFGISDEFHQMFTPGRTSEIWDLVADTIGGLLYISLYSYFQIYDSIDQTL